MKVLQLISSGIGFYGAERVLITLSVALEKADTPTVVGSFLNSGKEVHLEVDAQSRKHGLTTERIVCAGRWDPNALHALRDIVRRHGIDVIHCHGVKPTLYAVLARLDKVAIVSTCHLWTFESLKDWLVSAVERCLLHGVDRVVAVSDHIVPQMRRFGLAGEVIYNGIDVEPFAAPASRIREEMNWEGRSIIGAVGRLAKQKGLQYLIRAAPGILRDHPDALFVFVGDGPERESLMAEARTLGVFHALRFLGVREDIPQLLASMDVVAMPSVSEGLPMAMLEAMASRKAVVATRVGAIPRVIENNVNGILLSPGDVLGVTNAVRQLLSDHEYRAAVGVRAHATVATRFSAPVMAKAYEDLYRRVISGRALPLTAPARDGMKAG